MARRTLVALFTLALIVAPAYAQQEHLLLDMTLQTLPGVPSGHCLYLDAGRVVVEARLAGDNRWPVRFILGQPQGLEVPPSLDLQIRTPEIVTDAAEVQAGVYCYTVINGAIAEAQGIPDPSWEQPIAVRLTWLPGS